MVESLSNLRAIPALLHADKSFSAILSMKHMRQNMSPQKLAIIICIEQNECAPSRPENMSVILYLATCHGCASGCEFYHRSMQMRIQACNHLFV